MNTTKKLLAFMALMAVVLVSCEKDEEPEPEVMPPSNVAATVVVSTDNSGDVTVTPTADGASRFDLYWGDGSTTPTTVNPGSSATNTYEEGDYTLRVVAVGSTGLTAEITKPVNVTFAAPANLAVNAVVSETNLFEVTVTPTADNASMFDVDFGVEGADVQSILASESATYEYAEAGDYTITVTAKGAGAATSEATETVSITGPTGSIELPIDFEDATVAYEFFDFEGNFASVIDNPDTNGNESAKVGSILKTSGSAVFAGSIITLGSAIDFTQGNTLQMKAWSPKAGGTVKMKLEDSSDPPVGIEVDATTENASAWETLSFNFGAQINPEISYNKVIIFFDFGNPGDDTTYYFDDIELVEGASKERPQLPLGFENSDTEDYTWGVFGGVDPAEVIANPDTNGNTSANVSAITKNAGAEVWAGASLNLNGAIDWSAGTFIKMDVWSPRAGTPILLKLEDSSTNSGNGASTFAEVSASTTQAGMWETLYYDMTGANGGFATTTTYDAVVVFPDFGTNGGGETFYVDNIEVTADNGGGGGGGNTAPQLPLDFESSTVNYTWGIFGGVDPAEVIDNPDTNGNSSAKVTAITKNAGSEVWAGASLALDGGIDWSAGTTIQMDVWSPRSGIPVRIKLETPNGGPVAELDATTTAAGSWETLTWDMNNSTTGFDSSLSYELFVVFPDFGTNGQGETFYIDNAEVIAGGGGGGGGGNTAPQLPLDFESSTVNYTWGVFGGTGPAEVIDNPSTSGNTSAKVTAITKPNPTETWAGASLALDGGIDWSAGTTIQMDVWSPRAGVPILFKVETPNGGPTAELQVSTTAANTWETLTWDMGSVGGFDSSLSYELLAVFPDFGTAGQGETFYIDNIEVIAGN